MTGLNDVLSRRPHDNAFVFVRNRDHNLVGRRVPVFGIDHYNRALTASNERRELTAELLVSVTVTATSAVATDASTESPIQRRPFS